MTAVTGTFAVGWSEAIARTLGFEGCVATGPKDDPFELLLHRATVLKRHPDAYIVQCRCDVQRRHPLIEKIVRDLAAVLIPALPRHVSLAADPHDFFGKSIADGATGTMAEILAVPEELYGWRPDEPTIPTIRVPAHAADAPDALRALVRKMRG